MLNFFRSNQIFVAFLLALYILAVHAGALSGAIQAPANTPGAGLLYHSWFDWMKVQPFWSALMASFLVFIQAASVNFLADEFRLMGERNWFPGLFYALVASALPEFLFVSAPLVAITFVPFSLWRIFNAYQKPNVTPAIFDGALWIAVASLFYPPMIWLMIAAFAGIEVVRVFRLHERFVFVAGAFTPMFLGWLWYFWADRGAEFRTAQWSSLFQWIHFDSAIDLVAGLKTGLLLLLIFLFLFGLSSVSSRKGIQAQKLNSVLYWFLLVGCLTVFLRGEWRWEQLLLSAAPLAILLAFTFLHFKNRLWAELWHLGILLLVFVLQFSDFFLSLSLPVL